jgi:hypothetical protein
MKMRATMLHLKASSASKVGTKLGETHDDIHIVVGHIHILVVMGVVLCLCLLSLGCISLCTSLYWKPFTYIFGNHLHIWKNHDPFEVDYITHEKTWNKLFIHNKGKGIINFTLKRIHKWIIIIGLGGGRDEFFHSIILFFFQKSKVVT